MCVHNVQNLMVLPVTLVVEARSDVAQLIFSTLHDLMILCDSPAAGNRLKFFVRAMT